MKQDKYFQMKASHISTNAGFKQLEQREGQRRITKKSHPKGVYKKEWDEWYTLEGYGVNPLTDEDMRGMLDSTEGDEYCGITATVDCPNDGGNAPVYLEFYPDSRAKRKEEENVNWDLRRAVFWINLTAAQARILGRALLTAGKLHEEDEGE